MLRHKSHGVTRHLGFTLVELLVVIGIIAILIAILLPALNAARKQAQAVKCAAALREVYTATLMYASDNKGAAVPTRVFNSLAAARYQLYNGDSGNATCHWFLLLGKYVTQTKQGNNAVTAQDREDARRTVLWGCPSFPGYTSTVTGGINVTQPGYGMNGFPEYAPTYPPIDVSIGDANLGSSVAIGREKVNTPKYTDLAWSNQDKTVGTWYKLAAYQLHGAERALYADAGFYALQAWPPYPDGTIPGSVLFTASFIWPSGGPDVGHTTLYDFYRHGTYPKLLGANQQFQATGGKVSFNVCYADGHVVNVVDRAEGYRACRMRFPG